MRSVIIFSGAYIRKYMGTLTSKLKEPELKLTYMLLQSSLYMYMQYLDQLVKGGYYFFPRAPCAATIRGWLLIGVRLLFE